MKGMHRKARKAQSMQAKEHARKEQKQRTRKKKNGEHARDKHRRAHRMTMKQKEVQKTNTASQINKRAHDDRRAHGTHARNAHKEKKDSHRPWEGNPE